MALKKEIRGSKEKIDKYVKKWGASHEEMRELRKQANKLVSKSNKRLRRLEKGGYGDLPSLKEFHTDKGQLKQFSIKGQTYTELKQTLNKMKKFDSMKTSTINGVRDWLQNLDRAVKGQDFIDAKTKKKTTQQLYKEGKRFFSVYNKVIEYGNSVENGVPPYIRYKEIFKEINQSIQDTGKTLEEMEDYELDEIVANLTKQIDVWNGEIETDTEVENELYEDGEYNFLI